MTIRGKETVECDAIRADVFSDLALCPFHRLKSCPVDARTTGNRPR